ncbi:MAG: 4Fe-4S dicluster domain-containing protein [Spirochaetales bacterium]|nr:4Fe-4S dicluster domain-containing protein [Spirochaetales bacterium]
MGVGFKIVPENCTECKRCVAACALAKGGYIQPLISRIGIDKRWPEAPVIRVCRFDDCDDKPCIAVCPVEAIHLQNGYVFIDEDTCISCGACVSACPYGAIFMNDKTTVAINCDFCGGDPACVKECVTAAISLKEDDSCQEA